jgi:peptide/nickel transport system permease protein
LSSRTAGKSGLARNDDSSAPRQRASTAVRLFRIARRDPPVALSLLVVLVLIAFAIVPSKFTGHNPVEMDVLSRLHPPSTEFLLGTDHMGRDVLTRIIYATRTTLGTSIVVVSFAALLGITFGSISGFSRDEVMMRFVDLFLAFPLLVLAMTIVAILGPGLQNAMIALVLVWWAQYARLTRGLVLQLRDREFVTAAQSVGVRDLRILYRHILPNCFSPILVKGTLDISVAVLVTASLSFLGLGVQPPNPDWGAMISDGRAYIREAWWYPTFPGLAIFLTVMSLNLLGDTLRDLLDPQLRS